MSISKSTLPLLALCLPALLFSLANAEPVSRKLDAAPSGLVTVDNTSGTIAVRGWSRNEVEVTADLGRDVEELVFERNGSSIIIRVEARQRRNHSRISSDLVVRVPQDSSVNATGVSTDVDIRGVRGELRLTSISGDIVSDIFAADVGVETVSGDLRAEGAVGRGAKAKTRFNSVSGDIDIENLSGEINANTVSGDIAITGGSFERVNAQTTSGDVDFRSALIGNGRMDIETINGDLDVVFTGDVSATFDIETFNGDIRNCFGPEPERTSRYTPGSQLKFTEAGGAGRVTVRTLNGDLRLCRD
ncbi:MAG: DUF4097 family beta strand repeat-containing protein [Woeseia sp.]